jgi:hypothetical protein
MPFASETVSLRIAGKYFSRKQEIWVFARPIQLIKFVQKGAPQLNPLPPLGRLPPPDTSGIAADE